MLKTKIPVVCGLTVLLFFKTGYIGSTPIMEYDKVSRYEEYVVEHEISRLQARNAALTTDISSKNPPAGCQKCTSADMRYCLGTDLIEDHCCCDRRYTEVLPFVPHTCYLGAQICKPIVGDCAEYSRLRTCCCDQHVLQKWKNKSEGVGLTINNLTLTFLLLLQSVYA